MRRSRWNAAAALLILVVFGAPHTGRADGLPTTRVRTTDPSITRLLDDGARHSPTFAALLERFERTEWLVFVERGPCPDRAAVTCLLHTVGRYQGERYLRILLEQRPLVHRHREVSLFGHELQHALEAAETPGVIDDASLANLFRRIGYVSAKSRGSMTFETNAARQVEAEVLREMQGKHRGPQGK